MDVCSSLARVLHGAQPTAAAVCPVGVTRGQKFKCWPLQNMRSQYVVVSALPVLGDVSQTSGRCPRSSAGAAGLLQLTLMRGLGCWWIRRFCQAGRNGPSQAGRSGRVFTSEGIEQNKSQLDSIKNVIKTSMAVRVGRRVFAGHVSGAMSSTACGVPGICSFQCQEGAL